MDVATLKNTLSEPYVLTRPIVDVDQGQPIHEIRVGGRVVKVEESFRVSLYHMAKIEKLTHPIYEYEVTDYWGAKRITTEPPPGQHAQMVKKLDPYVMKVSELEARKERAGLDLLAQAVANGDSAAIAQRVAPFAVVGAEDDLRTVARLVLRQKGVTVPNPTPGSIPGETVVGVDVGRANTSFTAITSTPGDVLALAQALYDEDYNALGKELKALGHDVPPTKPERIVAARAIVEG